ncbi:hypothetical protein DTO280E4_532 [Paecilomyces variotii]|nr:hypothetical protein DTO280E4_532 [Paecilomyces variotii]
MVRRWMKLLRAARSPSDEDENEIRLKHAIERHASSNDHSFRPILRQLLREYIRFKKRPTVGLVDIFRCWTFTPSPIHSWTEQSTYSTDAEWNEEILVTDPSNSFSEMLSNLAYSIKHCPPGGVTLVAVAATPDTGALDGFFTFRHEVSATIRRNIDGMRFAPSQMICFLVSDLWDLPMPLVGQDFDVIERSRRRLVSLPSQKKPVGNLDPAQGFHDRIMLTWHSTAPSFVSDMHVEIWQQYKKLPEREFAHIRLFPATEPEHDNRTASATSASSSNTVAGGDNGARLFILFRSMNALHHFSYMRSESQVYARSEGTTLVNCRACQSEIVFSILAVFQVMKFESRTFLEGCTDELRKMELLGRQHPSVNKMRYLVHLEDCRFGAEESVTHALSVLKTLENWIREQETEQKLWDGGQSFEQRLEILRTDLEYLQDELVHTSKAIEEMQQKIREQLSLSRGRRDFILALLAAIYLPLSFTTSFFGMNMNTNTSPGPQAFSTWTNSSLDGLPADTRNSTEAIISAMNTSGSLNWTWEQFGIMLGCLILTLPLALAAGGIFRWLYVWGGT